ncbi:MAG: hypothetical protein ABSH56_19850 [Bryobacteraceae bacterium]|jgi:hypothetical protein
METPPSYHGRPEAVAFRTRSFREKPAVLRSMAREALEKHRRGETRPLDELLG